MKITQIMLAKGFGGAERLFVDLCLALSAAGQDIQAVCRSGAKAAKELSLHQRIKLETLPVAGTWDPLAPGRIRHLLNQHGSQVAQAHLARGAWLAGKACKKAGVPLVVTTHNYIDAKYYKNVTVLVPPTEDQYAYYLNHGFHAGNMQVIRHFSRIKAVRKAPGIKPAKLRIISLGRLVHKKAFHILVDAFATLQTLTDRNCELCIGGEGPEKQRLLAQIDTLGLKNKVALSGWVDDVASFLRGGDIFVLPSLDEPFGIVLLEAMANGLAVVSSNTKGPMEILDADIAWLTMAGDAGLMAVALQQACDNDDERQRKGENALQRFHQRYSEQAVIPQFIALFDSLSATLTKASPH